MSALAFFCIIFGLIGTIVAAALLKFVFDEGGAKVIMVAVLGFIIVFLAISSGILADERYKQNAAAEECRTSWRVCSDELLVSRAYKRAIDEVKKEKTGYVHDDQ